MIITHVIGGLGNQLFQYAFGYALAKKKNTNLKLDISEFAQYDLRVFSLDHFNVPYTAATEADIAAIKNPPLLKKIARKIKTMGLEYDYNRYVFEEKQFEFDPNWLKIPDNTYVKGYWQSPKYFNDYADDIRQMFTVKDEPQDEANKRVLAKIKETNSICLHVRRGDYVKDTHTNKFHGTCTPEYYQKAIATLEKVVENPVFFVFSDDIPWARENISKLTGEHEVFFMDHNGADKDYEDLRLMYSCKHFIIANSTFSWWGAWLSTNAEKFIVAPEPWFGAVAGKSARDLVPEEWLKINN